MTDAWREAARRANGWGGRDAEALSERTSQDGSSEVVVMAMSMLAVGDVVVSEV